MSRPEYQRFGPGDRVTCRIMHRSGTVDSVYPRKDTYAAYLVVWDGVKGYSPTDDYKLYPEGEPEPTEPMPHWTVILSPEFRVLLRNLGDGDIPDEEEYSPAP